MLPPLGSVLLLGYLTTLAPWLRALGTTGLAVYVGGFGLLGGFALLPTYAAALLGGWAFGDWQGLPAALLGFLIAAVINYAWAGRTAAGHVDQLLAERPRWRAVRHGLVGRSAWKSLLVVTLVRIPPNSPFALANMVMAGARVPIGPYMAGTVIGLAPRTAVAVAAGARLSALDFSQRGALGSAVLAIAVAVAALAMLGWLGRRALDAALAEPGAGEDNSGGPADSGAP
ncbi:MAG: TVP38/TMEM64 family protein [Luteitalea sp.]